MPFKIKPWPEGTKTPYFPDLIRPLYKLVRQAYALKRRKNVELSYKGYGLGPSITVSCLDIDENLSPEGLAYNRDQGRRSLLLLVIGFAAQQGYEMGQRHHENEISHLRREVARTRAREDKERKASPCSEFELRLDGTCEIVPLRCTLDSKLRLKWRIQAWKNACQREAR